MHEPVPHQVVDPLLWRQAQRVTDAHQPDSYHRRQCGNLGCRGTTWPCPAHQLAARAAHLATTGHLLAAR